MASDEPRGETTVDDGYGVTIPAAVRSRLDVQPGDKLRWRVTDDGTLSVEVVHQEFGALRGFEPVDVGETNAVEDHDDMGVEGDAGQVRK